MICDAKSCSMSRQWTLPEAVLDVPATPVVPHPRGAAAPSPSPNRRRPTQPRTEARPSESAPAASRRGRNDDASGPIIEPGRDQSEIAQKAEQGLIPFLIASAIGGLFALVMPCVWPMVPITVNFFVKQGQGPSGRSKATGLAIIYCLSIIGVFTAVGVLFSFFFSASALQTLANNPWLNLFVAALFVLFGLSLLGLFEIRLPSFLLNASAQGESRGGLVGVVFMALTLTITSFTCTFPVVGGLLVMAAKGDFFYPIIGLATFATVLALPFFLLALSPSLISQDAPERRLDERRQGRRRPDRDRRGPEVHQHGGAGLRHPGERLVQRPGRLDELDRPVDGLRPLSAGGFPDRSRSRRGEGRPRPPRLRSGFLGLALFLLPALFGHRAAERRSGTGSSSASSRPIPARSARHVPIAGGGGASATEVKATSTDPAQAERERKRASMGCSGE